MELFLKFIELTGTYVPDWVALIVCPALVGLVAVLLTVFGGRRAYVPCAVALGCAGFFLLCCKNDLTAAFAYLALFSALAGIFALLFLIPCPFRKRVSREEKRRARDEAIYEKFHEDLTAPAEEGESAKEGETPFATAEECGTCLSHVTTLLAKLKKEKLSPADRLETEALTRTVEGFRGKALSEKDLRLMNDCLAAVLKLTAKYKL